MFTGLLLIVVAIVMSAVAFFLLRYAAARSAGVRGAMVILAIENRPWAAVPFARRALFAAAGPFGCYLVAVGFVTVGLLLSGRLVTDEASMRIAVAPNGPAATAGLASGDRIVSVNNTPIGDWARLREEIAKHPGEPVRVAVERGGQTMVLLPVPGASGKILIGPAFEQKEVGVGSALAEGAITPPRVWAATVTGLVAILVGRERAEVSGPVGIVRETDAASKKLGNGIRLVGALTSYFMWMPTVLALIFFPRVRRVNPRAPAP